VRDAIRTRKAPPLERLFGMKLGEMGALEWAMCVSLVSWLVDRYPERTVKIVDAFKAGTGSKEALEAAFDSPLAKIEKAWKIAALKK
jgi:hypothetical protein